jgi:biopolymer transport protein ExbB/TolQ
MDSATIKSAIHVIASILEIPAIIILLIAVILVVVQLGSVIIEFFVSRVGKHLHVTRVLEEIDGKSKTDMLAILKSRDFQKQQKKAYEELLTTKITNLDEQKIFAAQLLADEETRLDNRVKITDIIARIAPMFGLMATLIPLGPGLIALGQGDTKTLSDSLLTAFDATVAGLASAGVAFIISKVRKGWYQKDLTAMETILEGVIK